MTDGPSLGKSPETPKSPGKVKQWMSKSSENLSIRRKDGVASNAYMDKVGPDSLEIG